MEFRAQQVPSEPAQVGQATVIVRTCLRNGFNQDVLRLQNGEGRSSGGLGGGGGGESAGAEQPLGRIESGGYECKSGR